jgi:hypothetical protein
MEQNNMYLQMPRICKAVIKGILSFKMKQLITSFFRFIGSNER